jgi:hypothetical protein
LCRYAEGEGGAYHTDLVIESKTVVSGSLPVPIGLAERED